MRAQVSLIPTESKKLIARAVARMDEVQNALKKGMVAMNPSSSTFFIVEELTGKLPATDLWFVGVLAPRGACRSAAARAERSREAAEGRARTPATSSNTWVIEKGELKSGIPLGDILSQMGPEDVYIKGVNAIDPHNTVGILVGSPVGGTIGLVMSQARRRGFKIVFPVGLEKLIPIPMKQAAQEASMRNSLDYSMGMPCTLLPCDGIVVTEPRAIELLTGATAVPISAGGIGGAEGAITMVINGADGQVTKAIDYIEELKGAQLPREVGLDDCKYCDTDGCSLHGGNKPWL